MGNLEAISDTDLVKWENSCAKAQENVEFYMLIFSSLNIGPKLKPTALLHINFLCPVHAATNLGLI